jgi:hypothetical protein
VAAGRVRAEFLEAFSPLVADVVVCGENLAYIALLAWPKVAVTPELRAELTTRPGRSTPGAAAATASSADAADGPPSVDHHEVSGQGNDQSTRRAHPSRGGRRRVYATTPGAGSLLAAGRSH